MLNLAGRRVFLSRGPVDMHKSFDSLADVVRLHLGMDPFLGDVFLFIGRDRQRPIAIGRKNWLFVASEDGGTWASILLEIFQTCRLQQVDALTYLHDIMPACIAGDVDPLKLTPAAYALRRKRSLAA